MSLGEVSGVKFPRILAEVESPAGFDQYLFAPVQR
jgi:hypothetical protein